jgi:predicted dehydrogenase
MVAPTVEPVRWGMLGAANIGVRKVIPAMQRGTRSRVVAIASRDLSKARAAADALGIPRAYGSYEELIADPEIEAIYNPLPNHLHVPWTIRAAEAGKHVLCEKPIALSADEARTLLEVRGRTGVQIGEAFMVRNHPQWLAVRDLVASGRIGDLRVVAGHFAYFKRDPHDVRSVPEWGGGGLMDVGCYPITMSRWLFGEEPEAVIGIVDRDPELRVDRIVSGLLRFPSGGQATFTCAMQLVHYQRMQLHGTSGRIEVQVPFNAPNDRPTRLFVDDGRELGDRSAEEIEFPVVDQYTLQGDNFSAAIRGERAVPVSVEDAVGNMAVIDALFRSATSGRWESPAR